MAGQIPRAFINDLLARTDIVDLIDARIKLKKRGRNYLACCPFHNEKTPSFSVDNIKQFYYCFGCGASGNAIDFLMQYDRLDFVESIEELATMLNLDVPYEQGTSSSVIERHQRQNLYQLLREVNEFYRQTLQSKKGQQALHYLHARGLNAQIIDRFAIGYAPPGWDNLLNQYSSNRENKQALLECGMLVAGEKGRNYDRFRNRVMVPIKDKRGRIIAFGGRVMDDEQPKYLNSPETAIFHKSRQLFGLYEAQNTGKDIVRLLLVEGYMDVIALAQFGIGYAVATLGTAVTNEHIQQLFRTTDTVICCFDGDRAGYQAAWKTLEIALTYITDGRKLCFMFLPDGEDPDSLVRKEGQAAFEQRIEEAKPLSVFLFDTLLQQVDLSSPDGRAKLTAVAMPLLRQIPGETIGFYLRRKLGEMLGVVDDFQLEKLLGAFSSEKQQQKSGAIKNTVMRLVVALLVQNPALASLVPSLAGLKHAKIAGLSLFSELVNRCLANPNLTTGQLLELYRGTKYSRSLETLATWHHMIIDEKLEAVFQDSLAKIFDSALEERLETLIARERSQGLIPEERRELWSLNQALAKK